MTEPDQSTNGTGSTAGRHDADRDPYAPPGFDTPRSPLPPPAWALPDRSANAADASDSADEWTVVEPRIRNLDAPEAEGSTATTGPIPVVGGDASPASPVESSAAGSPAPPAESAGSPEASVESAPAAPRVESAAWSAAAPVESAPAAPSMPGPPAARTDHSSGWPGSRQQSPGQNHGQQNPGQQESGLQDSRPQNAGRPTGAGHDGGNGGFSAPTFTGPGHLGIDPASPQHPASPQPPQSSQGHPPSATRGPNAPPNAGVPPMQGSAPIQAAPPSLADLRAGRPASPEGPATSGWRAGLRRATGGLIKLGPNEQELRLRRAKESVQRSLRGPRTVVVINTKGGGGKTTAVYSLAATFGQARGGYVLGWDNNETRGTLAWRAAAARHTNTAVDLLRDLERFEDPRNARVGDLDNYVRSQGSAQFDVLASDENAASAASIDDEAFRSLHGSLSRFYRLLIVDTGNNVKAPNWGAAVELADQIVVVSSIREDTAGGASWTLDHLMELGLADKVANAVTILSAPRKDADADQRAKLERFRSHFAARTRAVLEVPFDPALVDGDSIVFEALSPATRRAWLLAAAAIAEGI